MNLSVARTGRMSDRQVRTSTAHDRSRPTQMASLKRLSIWSVWSVLAVAYFGALLTQPPAIYDEGLIVSGAVRCLHGQLPYRDFNTGYPPAQFYTIAGVFSVFGASLLAERVWDTVWRLAIVGLTIVLARATTPGRRAHPVPLICGCVVTGACGSHLYPMISGMLPCLLAVWCAALYLNHRGTRWLFFSGIAAGAAALYRHDLAACVCGSVMLASCYQSITERKRRWLQFPAVFCAGVLFMIALPVLYFWSSVPHDALAQSFIDFPGLAFSARHFPLASPRSIPACHDFYLPLAVIVAAAITLRRAAATHRPTLVLLLMTGVCTLALATQRLDTLHAYPAIMFTMVLLCAFIPVWQLQNRTFLQTLLLSGAIFYYGLVPPVFWAVQMTRPWEAQHGIAPLDVRRYSPNEPPDEIGRAGPIRLAFDQRQAIRYIQRHLLPGRSLYVGTATHAQQSINDALFYFLADRPQATRFDMVVPGFTTSGVVQSEILQDIRQKQTEYVVLFHAPDSIEPNLSSVDSGVTILDNAIRQEYVEVAEFGRYTIWHRKTFEAVCTDAYRSHCQPLAVANTAIVEYSAVGAHEQSGVAKYRGKVKVGHNEPPI